MKRTPWRQAATLRPLRWEQPEGRARQATAKAARAAASRRVQRRRPWWVCERWMGVAKIGSRVIRVGARPRSG